MLNLIKDNTNINYALIDINDKLLIIFILIINDFYRNHF